MVVYQQCHRGFHPMGRGRANTTSDLEHTLHIYRINSSTDIPTTVSSTGHMVFRSVTGGCFLNNSKGCPTHRSHLPSNAWWECLWLDSEMDKNPQSKCTQENDSQIIVFWISHDFVSKARVQHSVTEFFKSETQCSWMFSIHAYASHNFGTPLARKYTAMQIRLKWGNLINNCAWFQCTTEQECTNFGLHLLPDSALNLNRSLIVIPQIMTNITNSPTSTYMEPQILAYIVECSTQLTARTAGPQTILGPDFLGVEPDSQMENTYLVSILGYHISKEKVSSMSGHLQ